MVDFPEQDPIFFPNESQVFGRQGRKSSREPSYLSGTGFARWNFGRESIRDVSGSEDRPPGLATLRDDGGLEAGRVRDFGARRGI